MDEGRRMPFGVDKWQAKVDKIGIFSNITYSWSNITNSTTNITYSLSNISNSFSNYY